MSHSVSSTFKIDIPSRGAVTVKVDAPSRMDPTTPTLILAHGANNNLDHPLLVYLSAHLSETATAQVVRFNFPYAERGAGSPDPRGVLETTFTLIRGHVLAQLSLPQAPLLAGGKSLGGRVAAELASQAGEEGGTFASGLVVLGYPLHAPGRKDRLQLDPLRHIGIPSLFCAGDRDALCDLELLRPIVANLVFPGELWVVEGGDHSLRAPRSSGGQTDNGYSSMASEIARFIKKKTSPYG